MIISHALTRLTPVIAVHLSLYACAPNSVLAQTGANGCRSADTVEVPRRLDYFKTLVSSTEADRDTVRTKLGLVKATASKVTLVTSRNTCTSLITALNTKRAEPTTVRQIWAFTLGGGDYAVEDPAIVPQGEFMPVYIFDKGFKFKSLLYPW
jgi:hypothetical protein